MSHSNWQNTIWREWRYTNDIEYGNQLFALVANEPASWLARACATVLAALTGATLAFLLALMVTVSWLLWQQMFLLGGFAGACYGFVRSRNLTWQAWLHRLEANTLSGANPTQAAIAVIGLVLVGGMIFGPLAWISLVGLFWGVGSVISWLNHSLDNLKAYRPEERKWWFWWHGRPTLAAVKGALRQASNQSESTNALWHEALRQLTDQQQPIPSPELLVNSLLSPNWMERFRARYQIVALGQGAVPTLENIVNSDESPLRETAQHLLKNIEPK